MTEHFGVEPFRGDRIVVRYRLGDHAPADWRRAHGDRTLSDVTGLLVDDGDPLVVDRDGTPESIPRAAITSIRLLPRVTVRNSQIRDLTAAAAWPGMRSARLDGWFIRAGGGVERRANSAAPVEFGARAETRTLGAIRDWYRERGLPALIEVPDRLLPAGQVRGRQIGDDVQMLVRDVAESPAPDRPVRVTEVLRSSDGPVAFADVPGTADEPIALGRGSVTEDPGGTRWLGLSGICTDSAHRRTGAGGAVLASLMEWGITHGAQRVYVPVDASDRVTGNWYRGNGFGLHHSTRFVEI